MKNVFLFLCTLTFLLGSLSAKADTANAARKTSSTSNTPRVEVVVTKTGGKAKTEVTISSVSTSAAGTLTTVKKRYTFEAGDYTRTKKFKVWAVEGLQVQVRLENKSFSKKFEYTTRVDEIEK